MDAQLFIHRKTVITLLPFPPSLSFALFCNTLETHISLTPLWPLTVLIGPTTFRWKAGLRWPFFCLSADPSILSTERQKNKQEPVAWKLHHFAHSDILVLWPKLRNKKTRTEHEAFYPADVSGNEIKQMLPSSD